jgi:hypothetical protein
MLTKSKIPLLITLIFCLELAIYLWAVWTTTLDKSNFFWIEPEFIFDKCARNSGRISSFINLTILLMIGYFGFKKIYLDERKKDTFRILITLFAVNHLVHFFYVFQNFKHHSMELSLSENLHGFITFIFILIVPIILWLYKNFNAIFYAGITLHLFNVSYFIMKTFYSKIKPDKPAYHNQLGIVMTTAALIYILYRFFREYKPKDKARPL